MGSNTTNIKQHMDMMLEAFDQLKESLKDSATFEDKAEVSRFLWDISDQASRLLEKPKDQFRAVAQHQLALTGEKRWDYRTPMGHGIRVTVQAPNTELVNIDEIRATLGSDFNDYVVTKYSLRKGMQEKISDLPENVRKDFLKNINEKQAKPRVSFR